MLEYICPECGMSENVELKYMLNPSNLQKKIYFLHCFTCNLSSNIKGDYISVILESEWTKENHLLRRKMKQYFKNKERK